jgi:hypothetical protein
MPSIASIRFILKGKIASSETRGPGSALMEMSDDLLMGFTYLNQIIKCTRRKDRSWQRELMVTENSALVTRAEVLPEMYDEILRMRRDPQEPIFDLAVPIDSARFPACPLCGNRDVFTCNCGGLSCMSRDDSHTCCPHCDRAMNVARDRYILLASPSGFVDRPRLSQSSQDRRLAQPPDFQEKTHELVRWERREKPAEDDPWGLFRRKKR